MAEDFMGGMKEGMSIFMMSSLAANYQAQQENMRANQQMRGENLRRQTEEDERQTMQADASTVKILTDPTSKVPRDLALPMLNAVVSRPMYEKFGGGLKTVSIPEYDTFAGKLDQFLTRGAELPTTEAREEAAQPLLDQAQNHVGYMMAYNQRAARIEKFVKSPGLERLLQTQGVSQPTASGLVKELDAPQLLALLNDEKKLDRIAYTENIAIVNKVANGEPVPTGALPQALAVLHGSGVTLGSKEGGEIAKGPIADTLYKGLQSEGGDFNQKVVTPFTQAIKLLDENKAIAKMAKPSAIEDPITALGSLLPPAQDKQFQQLAANLQAVHDKAQKDWTTAQGLARITKAQMQANPGKYSAADAVLLDQQTAIARERANALMRPYLKLSAFQEDPTSQNFAALHGASKELDTTLLKWEGDRQKAMSMSDKATEASILDGQVKMKTTQATNEFGSRMVQAIDANPELAQSKDNGTLTVQTLSKFAAPLLTELKAKYPTISVDSTSVLKELASASKPSVPPMDTDIKLSAADAGLVSGTFSGVEAVTNLQNSIINDGKVDRKLLFQKSSMLPFMEGRTLEALEKDYFAVRKYLETGKAASQQEVDAMYDRAGIKTLDNDATIINKMDRMSTFYTRTIKLMDPRDILQARAGFKVPAKKSTARGETAPASATFSIDEYKAFQKKYPNKSKTELFDMMLEGK